MQQDMIPALAGHNVAGDPCERIEPHIPGTVALMYVDYRDSLTDEQVVKLLTGDDGRLAVDESIWEWASDQEWDATEQVIKDACEAEDIDPDDLDDECREHLREIARERDTSDPYADLLRQTGDKLFRYSLDTYVESLAHTEEDDRAQAVAEATGLPADDPRIAEALGYAYDGGQVYLMWSGDVADAVALASGPEGGNATVTIDGAQLLVLSSFNGSGWAADLDAPITVPWVAGRVSLDCPRAHGGGSYGGWSWTDTTGGVYLPSGTVTTSEG